MENLKIQNTVEVDSIAAKREIERLEKYIGKACDLPAALWAIQTLYDAYDRDFCIDKKMNI